MLGNVEELVMLSLYAGIAACKREAELNADTELTIMPVVPHLIVGRPTMSNTSLPG